MGLRSIVGLVVVLGVGGNLTTMIGPRPGTKVHAGQVGVKQIFLYGIFNLFRFKRISLHHHHSVHSTNPLQATQSLLKVLILEDWLQCGVYMVQK